jgi:hypothetical protein
LVSDFSRQEASACFDTLALEKVSGTINPTSQPAAQRRNPWANKCSSTFRPLTSRSLVAKALAAGGTTYDEPEDLGLMYSHSFIDLDGHGWGLLHMSGMPEHN